MGKDEQTGVPAIFQVDETNRTISRLAFGYADHLAIAADGSALYASTAGLGSTLFAKLPFGLGAPPSGATALLRYDIRKNRNAAPAFLNPDVGQRGRALRLAPDGQSLAFVAASGLPGESGYVIPSYAVNDLTKPQFKLPVEAYPQDIAYHPKLPIVAATNGERIVVFDRSTGERMDDVIDLRSVSTIKIMSLMFSPGGKHLMVYGMALPSRAGLVMSMPIRLSDRERSVLGSTAAGANKPAPPSTRAKEEHRYADGEEEQPNAAGISFSFEQKKSAAPADSSLLAALQKAPPTRELTAEQLGRFCSNSVVVLEGGGGSGTGFFVTATGYILTCSHVLPPSGNLLTIRYTAGGQTVTTQDAVVVRRDRDHDLALLKIQPKGTVVPVRLELGSGPGMGAGVTVIGNPGMGSTILERTMTQGIVSSARREIDGKTYVQTSAAINSGSSGSPAFNARGGAFGVVVARAAAEGVGFVIAPERVMAFLTQCLQK